MPAISIHSDDFVPRLLNAGILATIEEYCVQSRTPEQIQAKLAEAGYAVTWEQFKQFVADVVSKGELTTLVLDGDNWPVPTVRPVAVGGIGIANGNVWFGSYGGQAWGEGHNTGAFRFYVNGVMKQLLTDYYITELATIGAESGDKIQICQVADSAVGWWAEKDVP
jgi:hypothetical protein